MMTVLKGTERLIAGDPMDTIQMMSSFNIQSGQNPPVPAYEWPGLSRILGVDLLARLIGISASSARRYPIPVSVRSFKACSPSVTTPRLHQFSQAAYLLYGPE